MTGDRFLLTTDGIHGAVSEAELIEMASDKKHALGTVTDEIATTIDGKGRNEGGGHDNLTLAIIETKTNSKLRSKMNKKTKLLLGAVSLICLLSLVFNGVLLGRNNSSASENEKAALIQVQDSLKQQVLERDSIIKSMTDEQMTAQSAAVNANSTLSTQVETLKREKAALENQLKNKTDENKELRQEIDRLKEPKGDGKNKQSSKGKKGIR